MSGVPHRVAAASRLMRRSGEPILYAVIACLRQVVMRKKFLIDEFGEHKGATDGFGKPDRIVVDNGWEFISISFQVCCEAAGISITWHQ